MWAMVQGVCCHFGKNEKNLLLMLLFVTNTSFLSPQRRKQANKTYGNRKAAYKDYSLREIIRIRFNNIVFSKCNSIEIKIGETIYEQKCSFVEKAYDGNYQDFRESMNFIHYHCRM